MAVNLILSVVIILSPFFLKKKVNKNSLPGMVTTMGVLGTFVGIFWGLLNFDVSNINASVPQLLDGLRIAFLTSIVGMIASIIIKIFPKVYNIKIEEITSDNSIVELMVNTLKKIDEHQQINSKNQIEQLKKIESALSGDGETTLLTQIQKLRTSFSDKQDDLLREFRDFTKTMAENNSKALIDALTQVMQDFNAKINEQFGDNFKQLNKAVEKILIWQEKYKEQMEQMIIQLERNVDIIEKTDISISRIESNFSKIAATSDDLEDIINLFTKEIDIMSNIAESAKNAFPIIENNINKLTKEFSEKVNNATNELLKITILQKESTEEQIKSVNEMSKNIKENVDYVLKSLNSQIDSFMKQNAERITAQIKALDEALQDELTKSLNSLGSQLSSLSNKFVEDYTPLTNKLKDLMTYIDVRNN